METRKRIRRTIGIATAVALAAACAPGADDSGNTGDGGGDYRWDTAGDGGADYGGDTAPDTPADHGTDGDDDSLPPGCTERAQWVYVVAADQTLLRFRPDDLSLTPIGRMSCPAGPLASPFSMSVDRDATAWVLYAPALGGGGPLYRVSTVDASCETTTFAPGQAGFEVFGMGFVSNTPGSEAETLFVAGGASLAVGTGSAGLATIDMGSLVLTPRASVPGWPELTGTGNAELWGFFPQLTPPLVQMIDKDTGAVSRTYECPELATGMTEAWAFAFWGGDFYLFHKVFADPSTNIWKIETDDGSRTLAVPDCGYKIVGAGVSTCAPVVLI